MSKSVERALTTFAFIAMVAGCSDGSSSGTPSAGGAGAESGAGGIGQAGTNSGGSAGSGGTAGVGGSPSPPITRPIVLDGTWYQVNLVDESEVFGLNLDGLDHNDVACKFPGPDDHPGGVDNSLPGMSIIGGFPTVAERVFSGAVVHINQAGQIALYGEGGPSAIVGHDSVSGRLDSPLAAGGLPRGLDDGPQLVWLDGPFHPGGKVSLVRVGLQLSLTDGTLEMIVGAIVPDTPYNRGIGVLSEACYWLAEWADTAVNAGPEDRCDGVSTGARLLAQEIPAPSDSDIGPEYTNPPICQ